jgi:hypothetical protein
MFTACGRSCTAPLEAPSLALASIDPSLVDPSPTAASPIGLAPAHATSSNENAPHHTLEIRIPTIVTSDSVR